MAEHTRGPLAIRQMHWARMWTVYPLNAPDGRNIASFYDDDLGDADARLFVAAPDLLTACRLAFALLNLRSDAPPEVMDVLASAVIKALGEEAADARP